MKYFTKELWLGMNSDDSELRLKSEKEWAHQDSEYAKYLDCIKHRFPQKFIQALNDYHGFHDFEIHKIKFTQRKRGIHTCEISLRNLPQKILLRFGDIQKMKLDVESFQMCICSKLCCGYIELSITSNNLLKFSMLCDVENEFQIECRTISLKLK